MPSKKILAALVFASLLLLSAVGVAAAYTCGGSCWYFQPPTGPKIGKPTPSNPEFIPTIDMNMSFSPNAALGQGYSKTTYLVMPDTVLSVEDINKVRRKRIGSSKLVTDNAVVRLVDVNQADGSSVTGPAPLRTNAQVLPNTIVCQNSGICQIVHGTEDRLPDFKFTLPGTYHLRIEYATTINASEWATFREFDVIVLGGQLEIIPPNLNSIGVKRSVYGTEPVENTLAWVLKNPGQTPLYITSVDDINCQRTGDVLLESCSFPYFTATPQSPLIIPPHGTNVIQEKFSAYAPPVSPYEQKLSINVKYKTKLDGDEIDTATGKKPVDQAVSYQVQAIALSPFTKMVQFNAIPNTKYYLQVCADGAGNPLFGGTSISAVVFDGASGTGAQVIGETPDIPLEVGEEPDSADSFAVASCSDPADLAENDLDGALFSFTAQKGGPYTLVVTGNVGSVAGRDFAKLGTSFDPAANTIPGESIVTEGGAVSLGSQSVVAGSSTSVQNATVNVFDRTKKLGAYSMQAPSVAGAGEPVFALINATVGSAPNSRSAAGPLTEIFNDSTSLFVVKSAVDGKAEVFARTDYLESAPGSNYPHLDVNLLWVDTEKYIFGVKGGAVGMCRDLQGDSSGLTGEIAKPHVKYDWRASAISDNECDFGNADYSVCDSAQFMTALLKRLDAADQLAKAGKQDQANLKLQNFRAYMLRDGFSDDFRADFDSYAASRFFADGLNYSKWGKYFENPARFKIESNGNPDAAKGIHEAGVYEVTLSIDFPTGADFMFFDFQNEPQATITVDFRKISILQPNVLYDLPIDGQLGLSGESMHRDGYGVGFAGRNVKWAEVTGEADATVWTAAASAASRPVAFVNVQVHDDFIDTTVNSAGQLLSISKDSGTTNRYTLKFYAANPVPVVFEGQGNGSSNVVSYELLKQGIGGINFGTYSARVTEIGHKGKTGGVQCLDPPANGKALPAPLPTDYKKPSSGTWCAVKSGIPETAIYGISNSAAVDANIYYESIYYVPAGSTVYQIQNACQNQGAIYVGQLSDDGSVTGFSKVISSSPALALSRPANAMNTIAKAIEAIDTSATCIALSGSSVSAEAIGIWWNEEKFLKSLREKISNSSLNLNACFAK
ncbi:MAG TPA: hypothetical protein VJH23_06615 [archaeon]|nr:hypothetical protein [archaeon]